MANLHFTLDKSAGKLLAQIAQEHLLCNLDPKKAIETFTMFKADSILRNKYPQFYEKGKD